MAPRTLVVLGAIWVASTARADASFAHADISGPEWARRCYEVLDQARASAAKAHPLFRELTSVRSTSEPEPRVGVHLEIVHASESARHYLHVHTDHHRGALRFYADVYESKSVEGPFLEEDAWVPDASAAKDWDVYLWRRHGNLFGSVMIMFYLRRPDRRAIRLFQDLFKPAIETCLGRGF